jgi:hypothetical protein
VHGNGENVTVSSTVTLSDLDTDPLTGVQVYSDKIFGGHTCVVGLVFWQESKGSTSVGKLSGSPLDIGIEGVLVGVYGHYGSGLD